MPNHSRNTPAQTRHLVAGEQEENRMQGRKIDLAVEAKELAEESAQHLTELPGVRAREEEVEGLPLTRVEILTEEGAALVGKPRGTYLTLTLPALPQQREEIRQHARAVAAALGLLPALPRQGPVLVVGLGNRRVTPDALGPRATEHLLVTRHLPLPFRPVAALAAGVTGSTGMESGELLRAVVAEIRPACVLAVDALAARRQERVCRTIQLCDTGIVPGSGVGNARMALDRATLGVPVLAVGVPTVVEAGTLCLDLLEQAGQPPDPALLAGQQEPWFVTPRSIDSEVETLAQVVGWGISAAVHVDFSVEDVENFLT